MVGCGRGHLDLRAQLQGLTGEGAVGGDIELLAMAGYALHSSSSAFDAAPAPRSRAPIRAT